ncbi:Signal transduction histidine-protein kinase BarA [Thalassocella blandensis]|nr:Signal transduction histidine-protein kinase BarA [Thalassocella blandensis]
MLGDQATDLPKYLTYAVKLALMMLLVGSLLVVGSAIATYWLSYSEQRRIITQELETSTDIIAPAVLQALNNEDEETLELLLERLYQHPGIDGVKININTHGVKRDITKFYDADVSYALENEYDAMFDRGQFFLTVVASEIQITQRLRERMLGYFIIHAITLAAFIIIICLLFHRAFLAHICRISQYIISRKNSNLEERLMIERNAGIKLPADELDILVHALETIRETMIIDIEQRKAIEVALLKEKAHKLETQKLIEEAKAANKAKSEFIATMSHEIRTPMNGVVGMVEMLRDTPLNSNQKHYLDVLYRSGESLLEIINDILDYSKIESGKMLLEKTPFDLEALIDDCFKLFSATASKREIELISDISPDIPKQLIGDPVRIKQIVVNLVGNAFKFTSEGHVYVRVTMDGKESNRENMKLMFSIKDSGIGISREVQSRLFEAFRQAETSTTRKFGGSGLGLAICKQLVELMEGEIGVSSEVNKGSTFWFTTRLLFDEDFHHDNPPSCSLALSRKRLLTINLSPIMTQALEHHVSAWNLQTTNVQALEQVLPEMQANKQAVYNFILINHLGAEYDGFETARKIREIAPYQMLPILMLTNQQAASFSQTQLYTVTSIVPRPISIRSLHDTLINQGMGLQLNPLMPTTTVRPSHSELNVLVAEDNAVNRMVIEGLLGKFEIKPDFAENGLEAVNKTFAADKKYDLILMDCEMPELDGFDATKRIREEEKNRAMTAIPIIALTAHVEANHRQRVFDCGMNHFLSKPITLDKLNEALNSIGMSQD